MSQQVEDALKDFPCTDEVRKRVLEWMHSNEESDLASSELSNQGSCVGDPRKVSVMNARIGSDIKGTKQELTASQGRHQGRQPLKADPPTERVDSLSRHTCQQQGRVDSLSRGA